MWTVTSAAERGNSMSRFGVIGSCCKILKGSCLAGWNKLKGNPRLASKCVFKVERESKRWKRRKKGRGSLRLGFWVLIIFSKERGSTLREKTTALMTMAVWSGGQRRTKAEQMEGRRERTYWSAGCCIVSASLKMNWTNSLLFQPIKNHSGC